MALVGDNAQGNAAGNRIVETDRGGAAPDIELTGPERRDFLGAGIEHDELGVDAFGREEALVMRDVEGRIDGRPAEPDLDDVRGAGNAGQKRREQQRCRAG